MGNILGMSIYTPSHWSVFSFCGLFGFDSDLYLGGGDGWARRSSNGVDAMPTVVDPVTDTRFERVTFRTGI